MPYLLSIPSSASRSMPTAIFAPDAIQNLFEAVRNSDVAAASGYVLPRYVKSVWERGRYIEYLFAFSFFKPIQDYFERPLISSGCFSIYRTDALRDMGGWSNRTLAEDMDLTWTFYAAGPEGSVCTRGGVLSHRAARFSLPSLPASAMVTRLHIKT